MAGRDPQAEPVDTQPETERAQENAPHLEQDPDGGEDEWSGQDGC